MQINNTINNNINQLFTRISVLENRVKELAKLVYQLSDQKLSVIGENKGDFDIIDNTIYGLSDELIEKLQTLNKFNIPFTGKIDISFSGCENIKRIAPNAFSNRDYLYHVSGIDLSKMQHLQIIDECAFTKVGYLSEDFNMIDLRNLSELISIKQEAFYKVGNSSKKFYGTEFGGNNNLVNIGARSFARIASKYVVSRGQKIIVIGGIFRNLKYIGSCAFANYKANYVYQKYKFYFICDKLKTIGSCAFRRDDKYGNTIPKLMILCPSTCEISDTVFGMSQQHEISRFSFIDETF